MRTETKWAVITTILIFAWFLIGKLIGLQTADKIATFSIVNLIVSLLIFITVYYMVTREKRDSDLNGEMTYKQGFWAAAIMTLIFIPLSTLVVYIFVKIINPDFASYLVEQASGGNMEVDYVNHFLKSHVGSAIFGGLLFSLLFPLFTRRTAQ